MRKTVLLFLFLSVQTVVFAQDYFPEGTKWTEIRLDTMKYDSWYSKAGDEWVQNFETIEYYVQGEYVEKKWDDFNIFKKVYTNGPEWTDSLTLLIREGEYNGHDCVLVSVQVCDYDGTSYLAWPGEVYQFDWSIGKGIYYEDILMSNTTSSYPFHHFYGIIEEMKEGDFGGVRPLTYVDLDGKAPIDSQKPGNRDTNGGRIIQGIGMTEWNDGECLFGPPNPYHALRMLDYDCGNMYPERHYRSMLVHFERNGEVVYDIWPEKGAVAGITITSNVSTPVGNMLYDLRGRRLSNSKWSNGQMRKGVYIKDGRKVIR